MSSRHVAGVGENEGDAVGEIVGEPEGDAVGDTEGDFVAHPNSHDTGQ